MNPIMSVPIERYAARRDQRLAANKFPSFKSLRDYMELKLKQQQQQQQQQTIIIK